MANRGTGTETSQGGVACKTFAALYPATAQMATKETVARKPELGACKAPNQV